MKKIVLLYFFLLIAHWGYAAKSYKDLVTIKITPNHYDWNYKLGEEALFSISLIKDQQLLKNVVVYCEIGAEKMNPVIADSLKIKDGKIVIRSIGMKIPGFLSCRLTAKIDGFT